MDQDRSEAAECLLQTQRRSHPPLKLALVFVWRQTGLTFGPGLFKAGQLWSESRVLSVGCMCVCMFACVCGSAWRCVCVCWLQGEA